MDEIPDFQKDFDSAELRDSYLQTLQGYNGTLTKKFDRFKEYFDRLINLKTDLLNEEERKIIEKTVEEDAMLITRFDDLIIDLDNEIRRVSPQQSSAESNKNDDRDDQQIRTADCHHVAREVAVAVEQPTAKLPKLELVKFDGDIKRWQEFWDSFQSSVHLNRSLSPVDKMNYLKAQLIGEAKKAISGLAATADNYAAAVALLEKRFGNKQAIIDSHYNFLNDLAAATNQTSSLRSVFDSLEQTFFSLDALGESIDHRQFISIIKSKLPWSVIVHLEEKNGGATWTVKNLRDNLCRYISAREAAQPASTLNFKFGGNDRTTTRNGNDHTKFKIPSGRLNSTTGALLSNDRGVRVRSKRPICAFCEEDHFSDQCSQFSTVEARKAKIKGSCFLCLKNDGHMMDTCWSDKPCYYCKRRKAHHQSLCPERFSNKRKSESVSLIQNKRVKSSKDGDRRIVISNDSMTGSTTSAPAVENALLSIGETVYLQTATSVVTTPSLNKSMKVRILMDSGSHRSYVSTDLLKKLDLKSKSHDSLTVFTFGSSKSREISTSSVDLNLKLIDGNYLTLSANVVPTITGAVHQAPIDFAKFDPIIKTLILADQGIDEEATIDLLIGSDYYSDIMTGDKIELSKGLYLLGSKLGWILNGRQKSDLPRSLPSTTLLIATKFLSTEDNASFVSADSQLVEKFDLQKFWDLDTIGIKDTPKDLGDEEALKNFNDTVQYSDNRYSVTWPWKNKEMELPSNFQLSLGRLNSLLTRYKDQPEIFDAYQQVLDNQIEKGVIEKIDLGTNSDCRLHYIPHHAVITPDRTTKLRIVYDGSAKARRGNNSLNDCLFRGPVLLEDICGLLIRFRFNRIAIIADIEKAFLQIGLQESERDVVRFLWLQNPKLMTTKDNLEIYRFARVPFGIISSPFLLAATVAYHLKKDGGIVATNILKNIYVDNVITGVDSVTNALEFYSKAKSLFQTASMNIREWASNSNDFIEKLPLKDRSAHTSTKVLGLNWNTITDELSIRCMSDIPRKLTKRSILKFTASIFDPLGLVSPTVLLAKLFFQRLWLNKYDWDDELSEDLVLIWRSIIDKILPLSNFKIPRFIGTDFANGLKFLHCFCDASKNAYGVAIYLQNISDSSISVDLLFAKARLAPVQGLSLPRLELLAVHIGSKCIDFILRNLPFAIEEIYLWTDSQCVLHWINSKMPLSTFVRNRVADIQKVQNINFRYVPSAENPADFSSRGLSATELISSSLWWHGPHFLKSPSQESWPAMNFLSGANKSAFEEKSILFSASSEGASASDANTSIAVTMDFTDTDSPFGIEINRFSSLTKLLRVTALVRRFIARLKKESTESKITAKEIDHSRILWIKYVQKKHFSDVFSAISNTLRNSLKEQLGLWIDHDGILRCGGRISNSELTDLTMHPILIPKRDPFTHLLILSYHKRLFHVGVSHTLAEIRKEFWIQSGRSEVFKVLRKCVNCKRFDGGPYQLPIMPPLPKSRVTPSAPFSYCGLDYFGPLFVKSFEGGSRKVWVCLFTCFSTRAVHLELIEDMSAAQFLMCLQRFISRRGKPNLIFSDNASQFKLARSSMELLWQDVISDGSITNYVSTEGINWKFLVERAPWQGGLYERLIRLVKQCLKKSIGRLCLTFIQLQTILTQIEAVLNSRPLAYVGSDFASGQLITPAHFLSLNVKTGTPVIDTGGSDDPDYIENISSKTRLLDNWKRGHQHLDQFWRLWRNDYLLNLRQRYQMKIKQPRVRSTKLPKIGDVVLIRNDGPRGTWKLARILELIQSSDGQIRSAKVISSNGGVFNRSLMHLFPLECDLDDDEAEKENSGPTPDPDPTPVMDPTLIDRVPNDDPEIEYLARE